MIKNHTGLLTVIIILWAIIGIAGWTFSNADSWDSFKTFINIGQSQQ